MVGKLWYLKKFDLFSVLSSAEVEHLAERTHMETVVHEQSIFMPGQPAQTVYILKKGRVRLSRNNKEGKRLTLALLEPGEIFGELSLEEDESHSTRAEAVEESLVCSVSKSDFREFLCEHPQLNLKITQFLGERRRHVEARVENLIFKDATGRLAYVLKDLFERHSTEKNESSLDEKTAGVIEFSHEELSHLAGLTRPTTTKLLNQFAEDDLLDLARKKILLREPSRLEKLIDSAE